MKTVTIDLGARAYEVRIGDGLLCAADELLPWIGGAQACVVTDDAVAPLYLERVLAVLAGKQTTTVVLPAGESIKTMAGANLIFDALLTAQCNRDVTVIALGGGVVGDIAGFAAACYQRGVAFIQMPTTLLAQVDSSVGGKTGVNHALGKNMIGAFHQPLRVIADTGVLATLDRRQFAAGMAEVIKCAVIADAEFFAWLEERIDAAFELDAHALAFMVEKSCAIKADIVRQDELEHGARALLNLGHTFGHAIETATGYDAWLHGEAVATGIAMAANMAARTGRISAADESRIVGLLLAAKLPVMPFGGVSAQEMLRLMRVDKKVLGGKLRLILPGPGIGRAAVVSDYPADALTATLAHFTAASTATVATTATTTATVAARKSA